MNILQQYPELKIIQTLAARKKASVYLVGGFLRDLLLGHSKMDLDLAVSQGALQLAGDFSRKIKGAYVLLDQERGCARVCKKKNGRIATYDFADFRAKTFRADLNSRDFTINTLAARLNDIKEDDEIEAAIIDEKSARKDLKAGVIRMVAAKAFKDDPLRILRAYSIRSTLGFRIEAGTLSRIRKEHELLRAVSPERIRDELFKVLGSSGAGTVLKEMSRTGVLETVIPQVRLMHTCRQGTYHHLDVWPHSLETVVQLDKLLAAQKDEDIRNYLNEPLAGERTRAQTMKLAALLHDIGKPETRRQEEGGRISFHGHEHVGKRIVRAIARMLKISTRERHMLEDIVRWHLRPGYLSNFKRPSEKAIHRYFRDTKEEAVSILLVSLADQRSTRGPATTEHDQKHHEKICLSLVQQYFNKKKEKPFVRLIGGDDLIRELGLDPSPFFTRVLTAVEEEQMLGKITTKKEAIEFAGKFADKEKGRGGQ